MDSINRRNFIRKAGAGAGAVAVTAATSRTKQALAAKSANERINVAVMGIRSRGKQHIKNFTGMRNVRVTTLCDIDERLFPEAVASLEESTGRKPKTETDIRKVLEDKDIDVISIASPNHWHSLTGIWACQAGKDVYVEKPASHNIYEGRKLVDAAHKYDRIVQTGSQHRSSLITQSAMNFIHSGELGDVYMIRAVIYRPRNSIGRGKIVPIPEGVDFDLFLGPAPWRNFIDNRFHYNWHWFWDTGNGETGNNGPHFTDLTRWAFRKYELPKKIQSMGGYYVFDCDQETPNMQTSVMEYADGKIFQCEVRGIYTNYDGGVSEGMLIYGSEGWMKLQPSGPWSTYFGRDNEPGPSETRSQYQGLSKYGEGKEPHFMNFMECVRSRKREDLESEVLEGHLSAAMCHLGNIAYRTGRTLEFDSERECFIGDEEAQMLVGRDYRTPYVVPDKV